jgi:hypothetical protein
VRRRAEVITAPAKRIATPEYLQSFYDGGGRVRIGSDDEKRWYAYCYHCQEFTETGLRNVGEASTRAIEHVRSCTSPRPEIPAEDLR